MHTRARCRRGVLAAIILAVVAVALAACQESPPARLATGLWLATPVEFGSEPGPIRIHHINSGFSREVGPPAQYRSLAWSPNGRYIATVRANAEDATVVIFDLEAGDLPYERPLQSTETMLSWSPDSLRLFALSAAEGIMLNPQAEPVGLITQPVDPSYPQGVAPVSWSPDSVYLGTVYHGYLMLVDRAGRNFFVDPALLSPISGPAGLTVIGWDAVDVVAVFDASNPNSPRRYSLLLDGSELRFVATTNFPAGTGPYSSILGLAERVAPGATVHLGQSAAPAEEAWVAVEPEGSAPTSIYHLYKGGLIRIAEPTFPGVPAHVAAAAIGLAVLPPIEQR